ncbi:MAG: hypothetical protein R6U84_00465, partial [Candidatus Cloacimonadales bacterium]
MIRVKAEIQYFIIIVIFILAVYVGIIESGIIDNNKQQSEIDFTKTEEIFEEKLNFTKIKQEYQSNDLNEIFSEIYQILAKTDYEEIYSLKEGNSFVGLYEIPIEDKFTINSLRSLDGLESEKVMKNSELDKIINIDSNLENYETSKREIQKQLSSTAISTTSKRELRSDLDQIQSKIDSLVYLPTLIERSQDYDLIYVKATQDNGSANGDKSKIIKFVKIFFLMLIVQLLGLVLLYLFLLFVTWLLKVLGVKTKRSSATSNYNNYYSRGQKKVKRIYKDKAAKQDE